MKIVHIVCAYPPYYGGMGNTVFEMVSELNRRGHEVRVLTPLYDSLAGEEEYTREIEDRARYAKRLTPSITYGNAARLPEIHLELKDADLVHLHYPFFGTANLVRRWKKQHLRIPLVMTYHMDTRGSGWKGLLFQAYAKFFLPRMLESADLLIGSSFDYIEASDARTSFFAHKEKWMELPFGVDIDRFQPGSKPEELFQSLGFDPALPTILFVGGMDPAHSFKGIPVLLEALLFLKKQNQEIQAIFVGDGSLREGFELKARGFGLQSNIRFVGKVSDEELPMYYNMADVFILPSIHQGEAFGMVLLEAMASGVAVIASDLPGVRTIANKGGRVFPPRDSRALADSIVEFFSEHNDRAAWAKTARQVVEAEYTWGSVVDRLEAAYNELVSRLRV